MLEVSAKTDDCVGTKQKIASVSGLVKVYNGLSVVNEISFDLLAGETTVLVGPNGSGKTTTMEMLVGLRAPTKGSATILNIPVVPGGEHRFYTGVQLQSSGFPSRIKTREVIRATECLYSDPADWRTMASKLGVDNYLDKTVDNLSGGQRRRLDILCAAIGRPSLLVLDEPTSGIDPEGRSVVWDFVRSLTSEGCTVLASTHDMAEAEAFADVLLVMDRGKIRLNGAVDEVLASLGGDRRLRITEPPEHITELIKKSGLHYGHTGLSIVAIGNADAIAAVSAQINHLDSAADILTGPVRLEDVFAVITGIEQMSGDE
ncbi:ABC transporter ATP-binding protein [Canibacter zhoujuaniae]|uniref:ABC transporter ATP-binding protein n=1 Tax=Canibacter zhoujuaniae TaxID=2708343 RepID=UPI0014216DF9|nr:ABC transporter ATP-binding protein [Canibacter zhoujuaniae]